MKPHHNIVTWGRITNAALLALIVAVGGCKTGKGTGTLVGTGLGAAIGAAAGQGEGALIGGAIGAGVGYIIGDQMDEKKAKEIAANGGTHNEVGPLGGTKWRVVSLNSARSMEPYESKTVEFYPDGRVVTTTTMPGGNVETYNESYRVVGQTLIVNKPGYMINAKYKMTGNQLIVDDPNFNAVLERL